MCYLTRALLKKKRIVRAVVRCSDSLYPWLSACVMQDGHRVWVGNSMTHKSRAKHPGQVVHIHLSVHTLRDPGKRGGWKLSDSLTHNES